MVPAGIGTGVWNAMPTCKQSGTRTAEHCGQMDRRGGEQVGRWEGEQVGRWEGGRWRRRALLQRRREAQHGQLPRPIPSDPVRSCPAPESRASWSRHGGDSAVRRGMGCGEVWCGEAKGVSRTAAALQKRAAPQKRAHGQGHRRREYQSRGWAQNVRGPADMGGRGVSCKVASMVGREAGRRETPTVKAAGGRADQRP